MDQAKKIQELELEIQKLKSRIRIDNKYAPGSGSTFFFTLPYEKKNDPIKGNSDPGLRPASRNWERYKILIVEDDYINYKLLEGVLNRSRVRIIYAGTGIDAVRICQGFILKPVNLDNFLEEVGKYMVES